MYNNGLVGVLSPVSRQGFYIRAGAIVSETSSRKMRPRRMRTNSLFSHPPAPFHIQYYESSPQNFIVIIIIKKECEGESKVRSESTPSQKPWLSMVDRVHHLNG